MLGRSEMMTSHRELFAAADLKHRMFRKLPQMPTLQARVATMARPASRRAASRRAIDRAARDAALAAGPHAMLIVSPGGRDHATSTQPRADAVRPRRRLASATCSPSRRWRGSRSTCAASSTRCCASGGPSRVGDAPFAPPDERAPAPVRERLAAAGRPRATWSASPIVFDDVTATAALQEELERNRRDLEAAYEELESTIDELETTNEELQSANEELQTTNEELQSTNEELETMNEELQSTNEELETINDELRERTGELEPGQRVPRGHPDVARRRPSTVRRPRPAACRSGTAPRRSCGACARTRPSTSTSSRSTSGSSRSAWPRQLRAVIAGGEAPDA